MEKSMIKKSQWAAYESNCKDPAVKKIKQMIDENAPLVLRAVNMSKEDQERSFTFRDAQCLLSYVVSTCDWLQRPEDRGLGELVLEDVLGLDVECVRQVLDDLAADRHRQFPMLRLAPPDLNAWTLILQEIQEMKSKC
jgi:hypothetical protein